MATERTVLVRLKANTSDFNRALVGARQSVRGVTNEIDTSNDRVAILAQSILGLGPAAIALGAAGIPAIAALATQIGVAGLAAGTAALAFNGVGDGLKALNDYQLKPTAENMAKLQVAMDKIGPVGEHFVRFLDKTGSELSVLQDTAREGAFPGMEEGITAFLTRLPQVNRVIAEVSRGLGDLSRETGQGLGGPKFDAFFNYLETDARPILMDMGATLGNVIEGFANLVVAFGPLTAKFSGGLAEMARSFSEWSRGLDTNDSFQSFLSYIEEVGPRALDFLGSLIDALVSIAAAAAPVGEAILLPLTGLLDVISTLAQTPIGPIFLGAIAAASLYGRVVALASVTTGGLVAKTLGLSLANGRTALSFRGLGTAVSVYARNAMTAGAASQRMAAGSAVAGARISSQGRAMAGAGAQAALLGLVMSGTADNIGLSNTASLALMGSLAGPWGAALGAAIGASLDLAGANDKLEQSLEAAGRAARAGDYDALTAAIGSAKKQIDDLNSSDGIGDKFTDSFALFGSALSGRGFTTGSIVSSYQGDLDKLKASAKDLQAVMNGTKFLLPDGSIKSFDELTTATDRANAALSDYIRQFDVFSGRLSKQQALIAFREGLRSLGDTVKANPLGRDLGATKQGDAVRGDILQTIGVVQQLAKGMKGLEHVRFMRSARADILKRAADLNLPLGKVQRLLDRMGILDRTRVNTKVKQTGAERATAKIASMRAEIQRIRDRQAKIGEKGSAASAARIRELKRAIDALRDKNVTVTTYQNTVRSFSTGKQIKADGGLITAGSGQSRGPKDDSIDALLSHREFVQPVAAVDYYGEAYMEAIRQRRAPKPRGYAEGGSVGGASTVNVSAPVVSLGNDTIRVTIGGEVIDARIDRRLSQHQSVSGSTRGGYGQ